VAEVVPAPVTETNLPAESGGEAKPQ
jgi:hypothetical protein